MYLFITHWSAHLAWHVSFKEVKFERESYRNDVSMQFCGRGDQMCEQLVCHLGNLEVGREASIHLEVKLNPNVLLQAPVTHADGRFLQSVFTEKMSEAALVISERMLSPLITQPCWSG